MIGRQTARYRRRISKALRAKVLKRSGGRCVLCGAKKNLTVDHIRPVSLGGSRHLKNLRILCAACNNRKGSRFTGWEQVRFKGGSRC